MALVATQHNDNARTGANLREVVLTASNVNPRKFGKLFERMVDGHIFAQPLYVSNVLTSRGERNVVYVATMHNTVYAFDADATGEKDPLWSTNLGPSIPLPDPQVGGLEYRDISVEVGIVSTPVISPAQNALYVVAHTKAGQAYAHTLHALDIRSGSHLYAGPRRIAAKIAGSGDGSVDGSIVFESALQNQRPGLLLAGDVIYVAFASFSDNGPFHGWVFAFNAGTLEPLPNVFNPTPHGTGGGIWQAGQGLAADDANNIYFITGNGSAQETRITNKVTVPELSLSAAVIANTDRNGIALAWAGFNPRNRLNILWSADGANFSRKVTLDETSLDAPGLAFGNGRLFLAWTGLDPEHRLNVSSSTDLQRFENTVTLAETSGAGPALAFGNGRLFIAWVGTDPNSSLNVMSSVDGVKFGNKVTLGGENSTSAPGLSFLDGRLYLYWCGTDPNRRLNILESTDGLTFRNKVTLDESSNFRPALVRSGDMFCLAWTGRDASGSLNLRRGRRLDRLTRKDTYSEATIGPPGLVENQGRLLLSWSKIRLYIGQVLESPLMYGDSFVKLRSDLSLADWFTPWNTQELNQTDTDLGSGGVLLIPGSNLLVGGSKEGKLYVLDRNNLGHFCGDCNEPAGDTQIVQWFQATGIPKGSTPPPPPAQRLHHIHGSTVYWKCPIRGPLVYVWGEADWIRAYAFNGRSLNSVPVDMSNVTTPGGSMPGAMLSISASGSTRDSGILWASHPTKLDANQAVVPGIVRAFDASNLQRELWNSDMSGARDALGNVAKFAPPTIANGKVYVATCSNKLVVYGLF